MKRMFALAVCLVLFGAGSAVADKPVMGVAEFTNQVSGVHWWNPDVGWELSGMLTNELSATGAFSMVERSKLEHVLVEQDLAASGRIEPGTGAKMGKLVGAQYMVMGTVTAYEEGVKGTGGGIGYKGLRLGGKKGQAYLAVDLRVVDSTRGTVEFVRSVEARAKSKGVSVGGYRSGFSGSLAHHEKTPTGKAIRAVVVEIAGYLECAMVKQDGCMADYDAKEAKRKESLKKGISLD
ncbi:MAG: penicillin-binding protein activator LpoB [bacterium]|nr:penicillin-binding protein activator LpoB [bacterium]